jgi:hypothetical protein
LLSINRPAFSRTGNFHVLPVHRLAGTLAFKRPFRGPAPDRNFFLVAEE